MSDTAQTTMKPDRRVGVFGGTFDPVHLGHLAAAEEARFQGKLDTIIFVPNHQQPLKGQAGAAAAHRLAMLELAIAGNPAFSVSKIELDRPAGQPSYSLDTLLSLQQQLGLGVEIVFLLGLDALHNFAAWRSPDKILEQFQIIALTRAGQQEPDWSVLETINSDARQRISVVTVPDLNISSSDLRRRLAAGRPLRYQVPDAVHAYLKDNGLYRSP